MGASILAMVVAARVPSTSDANPVARRVLLAVGTPMTDLLILAFTTGCYVATVGFMRFCDRI